MKDQTPVLLLVDDNLDLLEMYEEVLQIDGVKTMSASSGKMALDICNNLKNVKVIISDCNMGEMSGMQLLLNVRKLLNPMPAFYLLTGSLEISEEKILSEGGKGLILKPFDLSEVLEIIKKDFKVK